MVAFNRKLRTGAVEASRDDVLAGMCRGRRVLHVGCTDAPFTSEKLTIGGLLHERLLEVADDVLGVDIDGPGLDQLARGLGGRYLEVDVSSPSDQQREELEHFEPEIILAADVLEHVADQSRFLRGLSQIAAQSPDRQVLISTPNSLAVRNTLHTLINREVIHPDHRLIHSPRTLEYALANEGLNTTEVCFYNLTTGRGLRRRAYDAIPRAASAIRPAFADGLIFAARASR